MNDVKEILHLIYFGYREAKDDKVVLCLMVSLNLAMWLVSFLFMIWIVDAAYKKDHSEIMRLESKSYQLEFYTPVSVNNVVTMIYNPARYFLEFNKVTCSVSEDLFNNAVNGDEFRVNYYNGLSTINYCTNVTGEK